MRKILLFLMLTVSFVSCDLFMTSREKNVSFSATSKCTLDTKVFSKYFTNEISNEINCLGLYLNDFIEVVKTDRPGFLSLRELVDFIEKNLKDFDMDLIDPIRGVFLMNSLLYGDHPKYISRSHVNKLVMVFREVNKIVVRKSVYNLFVDKKDKDYTTHNERKSKLFEAFINISRLMLAEYKENDNKLILTELLDHFRNLDESNIIDNSEKLVFVKKIILGGKKNSFSALELKRLLEQLPDLIKVVFDFSQFQYISKDTSEEEGMIQTLNSGAKTIVKNLFYDKFSRETLFTLTDLFEAIKVFYPELSRYEKYKREMLLIKDIFIGSNSDNFSASEIYFLFKEIVQKNLDQGEFFYRIYRLNEMALSTEDKIRFSFTNIFQLNETEEAYLKNFNRIVQKYQYYKGSRSSIISQKEILRSPYSIFEISVLENLVVELNKRYASEVDGGLLGGRGMTQENLNRLFEDFKRFLIDEKFVFGYQTNINGVIENKDRIPNTVETVTLMSTLFQNQSSGDEIVSVEELTEFALVLMSSTSLAKGIYGHLKDICEAKNCQVDARGRLGIDFYREHLNDTFDMNFKGRRVREYLPGLATYIENDEGFKFLKVTEKFARDCAQFKTGEDVPLAENDLFAMLVGMSAIEHTINRFDLAGEKNGSAPDGILQPDEVLAAYPLYENAVKAIIPVGFLKKYSKAFFQYLIKYEKIPDVQNIQSIKDFWKALKNGVHFVKFLFTSKKNRRASASRYTIAKILEVLAEFSPETKKSPFPCEQLR